MMLQIGNNAKRATRNALTLIEVVISVAILSVGLTVILSGLAGMLNTLRISQNNLKAGFVLGQKMAQLELKRREKGSLEKGFSEDFEFDKLNFQWDLSLSPVEDFKNLKKVVSLLSWQEGRREGSIKLPFYLRSSLDQED
ncbi:MAG: prepilin-type N-terminal cleavage/methylation domain-containing protein [Candidatus Omnitrophica bacterium]|nr:prepilin-type N-terminal cleavage/methylation domain-containing protein [Candidatus Omnitrophota bacterium]MCF7876770.1 prepilin-type N-terminal cleavage/methylation domain-containing protein [Candidatus Omnitrophota bacterium]